MGLFSRGDVVIVPFPFSNQAAGKVRPALVVAAPVSGEVILGQITSSPNRDGNSIPITAGDFSAGNLRHDSFVRVSSLFTYEEGVVIRQAGRLKPEKVREILDRLIDALRK